MIPEIQGRYAENRGDIEGNNEEMLNLMNNDGNGGVVNIQQLAGVIETDDIVRLRRLVFRGTKGKSYMYIQQIDNDENVEDRPESNGKARSVYIIVFWDGVNIRDKIERICDSFSGNRFQLPSLGEIDARLQQVQSEIKEKKDAYDRTKAMLRKMLYEFDSGQGEAPE